MVLKQVLLISQYFFHEKKVVLKLNKPIYVGCTVLELSKLAMYEFFYDFWKKRCKNVELYGH